MDTLAATSLILPTLVESYKMNAMEKNQKQEGILTGMFLMSPISTSLASLFARASSFAARPHLNIFEYM